MGDVERDQISEYFSVTFDTKMPLGEETENCSMHWTSVFVYSTVSTVSLSINRTIDVCCHCPTSWA